MHAMSKATSREDALNMELTDALKKCGAIVSEREHSSEAFQVQREVREAKLEEERERLQARAEQLSGDVLKLTERLKKEQAACGASIKEVCSAPTAVGPWGGRGGVLACRSLAGVVLGSWTVIPRVSVLVLRHGGWIVVEGCRIYLGRAMGS